MSGINELQNWFYLQCDGAWEHHYGVTIETCDNPGWWVKIDLKNTSLENVQFAEIQERNSENWIHCYVKDNVFNGAGNNLSEILNVFVKLIRN